MKKKLIPKAILKNIPLKFLFLETISLKNDERIVEVRTSENMYYKSKKMLCGNSYRNTSKLIDLPDK